MLRLFMLLMMGFFGQVSFAADAQKNTSQWQQVIRDTPYSFSSNMAANLSTIRRWLLLSKGFCEQPDRHILFDQRGNFLTWMQDADSDIATQNKLNQLRQTLQQKGKVSRWIEGAHNKGGYPFAFSCDQPWVNIQTAIDRVTGKAVDSKLWGTWDGIKAGSSDQPISLSELVALVFDKRQSNLKEPIDSLSLNLFLAQLIVESGAVKYIRSDKNAVGMLQIKPEVLDECGISKRFYQHRMAQVDCAVRLYVINQRNLKPVFEQVFGHLPEEKKQKLFALLLLQAYHAGIGAVTGLLSDEELGKAAAYFATHHKNYSAQDIATGLVFHNLGKGQWGWASLYYGLDIQIVAELLE